MMLSGSGAMETALQAESQLGSAVFIRTIIVQQEGAASRAHSSLARTQSQSPGNKHGHIC